MPVLALGLVLIAALLHAIWNFFAKGARDSSAFMWWGVTVGAIWYGAWVATQSWLGVPREIWVLLASSLAFEIAYVAFITRGYQDGDLSQVYPIARGSPPLFIALWSAIFLGERLPWLGYAGIVVLMIGIYLASLPAERANKFAATEARNRPTAIGDSADAGRLCAWVAAIYNRTAPYRPAQIALIAAICVSIYSTLDKVGVGYSTPLVYNAWVYAGIAIGYAPFVWSSKHRASTIREWKTNWRVIIIGSFATVGSYWLALTGMSMTAASYVGAVRATSVVIGALFGWLLLKESFGAVRVFAAALMVVGLAMVAMA